MSQVRIFFNPLDAKSLLTYDVDPGTKVIDFLGEHYPEGFDGAVRWFVGIDEYPVDDLDYEIAEFDSITILVMPSGGVGAFVATAVIQALVAFSIGYVINLLFSPEIPGDARAGDESAVYSLSPTRNQARLGQPIPVMYGRTSTPPPFASAPYSFFSDNSNDQFVDQIMCLGQGYFEDIEIYIGDSPVSSFEDGTVKTWIFNQDEHEQRQGKIQADIWDDVENSSQPHRFFENVYTSVEVDSWRFEAKQGTGAAGLPISGDVTGLIYNPFTGTPYFGNISNVPVTMGVDVNGVPTILNPISAGDEITLSGTVSNNITFTVGSVLYDDTTNPTLQNIYQDGVSGPQLQDESPLPGGATYSINPNSGSGESGNLAPDAGPFRVQKEGEIITRVRADIVFEQGLYHRDSTDGDIKQATVRMEMEIQEIDPVSGLPTAAPAITKGKVTQARSVTPIRTTIDSGTIPDGAYQVTVRRTTPIYDTRTVDTPVLTGLKGMVKINNTPGESYGPVTLICLRMKATNGLAQAARSRVRVTATRVLDPLDPAVISSNPITALKDVWTNSDYGLARPLSQLNLAHLDPIETEWSGPDGPRLNGAFDQRGTGYNGMQSIASSTGSKIVNDGGLTSMVQDKVQKTRVAVFNSANILKDSLELIYNFDTQGDYNGIIVEYRNANSFDAAYATYPVSPEPTLPDTYTLFGVTDPSYAEEMAHYYSNVKDNRRKLVKFDTELDGFIVKFGDRIGVSVPMANYGESGVVFELISATSVRVDKALDWSAGSEVVLLRDDQGRPDGPYAVTQGATPDIIVFGEVPAIPLYDMEGREPSSYIFGVADNIVMDFVVSKVTPKGDTLFTIEGQTYSDAIYDGAPPHMGGEPGFSCSSYQDGLVNSGAMAVYYMTDGLAYAQFEALRAAKETGWFQLRTLVAVPETGTDVQAQGQGLISDPCSTEYSIHNSLNRLTDQVTIPASGDVDFEFTMSQVMQRIPGDSGGIQTEMWYRSRQGNSLDMAMDANSTTLRLTFIMWGETDPPDFTIPNFRTDTEICSVAVSYSNATRTFVVYKNWETQPGWTGTLAAQYQNAYNGTPPNEARAYFSAIGRTSHYAFWDYAVDSVEVEALKSAWDSNIQV